MLLQTLIKYISLNFKYRLRRKTEFFAKILSRWLPLNTINKNIFPIILSVSFFKYILFFSISFFFVKFGMQFLNNFEIISGFFYAIILISLFISAGFVPNVLLPADENILNTSPLSNKEIFIFHWMAHLFNYHISFFIYILIFSLVLFLSLSVTKTFWFSLIIFLLFILLLIFSISIFLCIVTVNRIREGFRWSTLLISLVNGFIAFIISYIICHSIFSWVTSNPNFLAGSSWSQLIEEFFITYKQILDYSVHSYFIVFYLAKLSIENDFMNYIFPLLFFITLIHILFIFSYLNAGKWHRTAWETRSKIKKDWIDVIQQVFLLFSKNIYFRTQVLNLFRNRIQISHHYTFFFFHYSNYIFLGIAAGAMGTVTNDFPILRLCLLFFLYNAISRDAFEAGTTLFPGILRYDGEGKTIQIYRITNDNPLNLYKAKIQLQRLLGMAEFIIIFIGLSILISLETREFLFVCTLSICNYIIIPHIKILPSFASPHFNKQHYSEADDFEESKLWEETIESKLSQFLFIFVIAPIFFMILMELKSNTIYFIGTAIILIYTLIGSLLIHYFQRKITKRMIDMDL